MMIEKDAKILVLAPHPDDFDAIAITLKQLQQNGNSIFLVVISGAASGVEDSFCASCPNMSKSEIREQEQLASCKFFGLPKDNIRFLRLKEDANGDPEDSTGNLQILKTYVDEISPGVVFMPHWNDTNPGHRRTYSMFKKAECKALIYLNRDAKTIKMRTDYYTFFGVSEANWKAELLRHHISQHQRNLNTRGHGLDERVLQVNRNIAKDGGSAAPYAEAFEIEK